MPVCSCACAKLSVAPAPCLCGSIRPGTKRCCVRVSASQGAAMTKPPRPDKLPGPIRYKKPGSDPEDRPLERLRREFEDHQRAQQGERPRSAERPVDPA